MKKPNAAHPAPRKSRGILHDLFLFFARRPAIPTLIEAKDPDTFEDYVHRIRQRVGISVTKYAVLNVHRIGIEAPLELIFEELLTWNVRFSNRALMSSLSVLWHSLGRVLEWVTLHFARDI